MTPRPHRKGVWRADGRHPAGPLLAGVIGLLSLCGGTASAQGFDTAPPPAAPRPLEIAAPTEQRLANGLRVLLAPRSGVRLVTAQLLVLSGSEVDPPRRAGLASLAAGLLTKGTQRRSASAQVSEAESLGGSLESGAGWNQSHAGITVTVPQIDRALSLLADAVIRPTFAQTELDRLRAQSIDAMTVAYSQPGTLAVLAADRLTFGARPYGHPADGTPASLRRITRADLLSLHAAHYRPDNAVLLLAGDLDDSTALRLAAAHFGAWKAPVHSPTARLRLAASATAKLLPTQAAIDIAKAGQAAVVVAVPLPPLDADRATASVLNTVLGSDFSSRLNQQIRIERGLSYGVSSQIDARPLGGALRITVQTRNATAAEVVALVQAALDQLIASPVPEAELAVRKAALIGAFGRSVETTAGLAAAMRSLVVAGLPVGELRKRIGTIEAVSAEALQRFAAANLGAGARRIVVAGESAEFAPALRAREAALVIVPQRLLDLERDDSLTAR